MKKFRNSSISLVLIILSASLAVSAQAKPVRAHATLLSLFERSDAIMIARFDKREDFGTNRVENGFTIVTTRTFFDISSVLKGEAEKFVVIKDDEFRYQVSKGTEAPSDAVFSIGRDPHDGDDVPKPGDTVLLFLKKEGDSLVLADEYDGVRKVGAVDQAIYVDRIKELNSLFENGDADPSKVASWLVRCVQQPATRWDGTHELMQGFRHLEWREQKDVNGYERIDPTVSYIHGADAAKALGDEQKNALTQILVNSDLRSGVSAKELSDGDRELIALVRRWDPKTAANYLLSQLRSGAFTAHENAGLMWKISELIGDDRSGAIARSYRMVTAQESGRSTPGQENRLNKMIDSFVSNAENVLSTSEIAQSN